MIHSLSEDTVRGALRLQDSHRVRWEFSWNKAVTSRDSRLVAPCYDTLGHRNGPVRQFNPHITHTVPTHHEP